MIYQKNFFYHLLIFIDSYLIININYKLTNNYFKID